MHEFVGLLGLGLYVFAPLCWGLKSVFGKFAPVKYTRSENGTRIERIKKICTNLPRKIRANLFNPFNLCSIPIAKAGLHVILACFLLYFAAAEQHGEIPQRPGEQTLIPTGLPTDCHKEMLKDGVVKYTNDSLLIYVKPVRGWYDTEHTPLICWQGSGYEFGQIQEQTIGTTTIYTGILAKKGAPKFYTAWWFDNGTERTVSQARWRWLDAGGAPGFSLVNVTASDKPSLEKQVLKMMTLLRPCLRQGYGR